MYILNQSIIDLSTSFALISTMFDYSVIPFTGPWADLLCKLWATNFLLWGLLISSTYNLLTMTLERYLGVVHTVWHKVHVTRSKVKVTLPFPWLFGLIIYGSYSIPSSVILPNGQCGAYTYWSSHNLGRKLGILIATFSYIIPLLTLTFCYASMAVVIGKGISSPSTSSSAAANQKRDEKLERIQMNTIKTLLLVGLCYLACWSYNIGYYLMFNLGYPVDFSSDSYHYSVVAVYTNCCLNPLIYALKYEQFQARAKELFLKLCR